MTFVGGKLNLKGVKKKKKKKSKEGRREEEHYRSDRENSTCQEHHGEASGSAAERGLADNRTKAEKRFDEIMKRRELDEIMKAADKTHRQRVKEFNEKLASMSEHYDIPKVGPG
mmetsp:Transcript_15075/g.38325  ORF Transcript_15075/g.38325 Transcript_15075/m.38325 type:complete len:114 (+) Transcript_15075:211-552(+)